MSRRSRSGRHSDVPATHDSEFTDFVGATGAQLLRAALLLTGDHHLAEDLVQTTYAKVFLHWRKVSRADVPLAYARTTLLNTFLSERRLRRAGERPARSDDVASGAGDLAIDRSGAGGLGGRPPDDPAVVGTRVDLLEALAALPPLDRAVVVLRYWEDRSVAETAQVLDLAETVVRTRAHRALARLRPLLATTEQTDDPASPTAPAATLPERTRP
ncbi:SigE family RNA polymerase sigma factor [Nocardioides sp.]|uniref:SigE family RNA polymerase sigma factor n=1 Tax=Nocardioides sp. TaxID=35761 RepID=UPI0035128271